MKRRSFAAAAAKVCLLLFSLAFSLLVGEVALRMLGYQAIYEVYSKPSILWQYDPLLGWSHEPGAEAMYIGPRPWPIEFEQLIAINSLGLRGPEVDPQPAGGQRILFMGDSMVAGFEVAYEQTFPKLTGDLLSESLGIPIQIVNAGVRGYGTDQSYLYYRERGRALDPDIVVMFLSVNDLVDDVTIHGMRRIFAKPALVPDGAVGLRLLGSPVPDYPDCSEYRVSSSNEIVRVDGRFGRVLCRLQMTLFDQSALFSFITNLVPWEQWGTLLRSLYHFGMPAISLDAGQGAAKARKQAVTDRILREIRREVESDGGRLILVSTPGMLAKFEAAGVKLDGYEIVSLKVIEDAAPEDVHFVHDSHFNVSGHQIAARALHDALLPVVIELESDSIEPVAPQP